MNGVRGSVENRVSNVGFASSESFSPSQIGLSTIRREDLPELLDQYGQIIVDECHHLSAISFEGILKQAKARYVMGLTATPFRRNGHDPIIFMQCGPIRHRAISAETAPSNLKVFPRALQAPAIPVDATIQDVFHLLAVDELRNQYITEDILAAYADGRKILALTERTEHLSFLHDALGTKAENCFVLHGRLSKKQRATVISELESLDDDAPRILLATGRLIGEGFDHPPLDTLVLAMPVSWKGTLQQYAGLASVCWHADRRGRGAHAESGGRGLTTSTTSWAANQETIYPSDCSISWPTIPALHEPQKIDLGERACKFPMNSHEKSLDNTQILNHYVRSP